MYPRIKLVFLTSLNSNNLKKKPYDVKSNN